MLILLVGGGSGGHVTPLKAVAKELLGAGEDIKIKVVTDRRFYKQAISIFSDLDDVEVEKIFAGKLRRYNSKSFLWHIAHLPTVLKNFVDIFKIVLGLAQMLIKLLGSRPDVVFSKGGFVAVPACIAAKFYKVPIVIHDSDAHPGLSSRITARWAEKIATGMPKKFYDYPKQKTVYTGIPTSSAYKSVSSNMQLQYKKQLGFDSSPLLLVTGGGTGAERLNEAILEAAPKLIDSGWQIAQVTGYGKAESSAEARSKLPKQRQNRWRIEEFIDLTPFILAADVVVARTGATTMQELANAQKTVVTVPSRFLAGGHQLKNAVVFKAKKSALVLDEEKLEEDASLLIKAVSEAKEDAAVLSESLHKSFAKPGAAGEIAKLILDVAGRS